MSFSRSRTSEPPAVTTAQQAPASPLHKSDETVVEPPRWGLLAAVILVALITAAWVGSAYSTAQGAAPQSTSTPGK